MGVKFEDLKKEREQRMKAGERPWWEKLADAFVAQYDAEAQAYQGGFSLAGDGLEYPQRQLKKNISGDEESWGLPDFSYDVNVGNRAGYRGTATVTDEIAEAGLDFGVDPVAPIVGGVGLAAKGIRTAQKLAGPRSLKGNTMGAAKNFIPNNYGPSGVARPNVVDELLAGRVPGVQDAQQLANAREKVGSFVDWGADSVRRGIEQTISPSARALYREQGINQTMQEVAKDARVSGKNRDRAKAVAQVQASGVLIPDQAGRRGPVSLDVQDIDRRSFLTEPVPATQGSYTSLVKDNDLKGKYDTGRNVVVSDKDLKIVDEHVGKVWRDRDGVPLNESEGAHIRIKNAGAGDQITGAHHADFVSKSGVHRTFSKLFKDGKNHSLEEMHEIVENLEGSNLRLHPKSKTMEDVNENGLWVTGSFSGTAITEGGVNFIAKISPNGRVMAVVSDEHNFLEKIPAVGKALELALPNRSISVTPPMHFDLKKNKAKVKSEQPKDKKNVRESLFNIETAQPSREALRAERQINAGVTTASAGMLTGVGVRKDEER